MLRFLPPNSPFGPNINYSAYSGSSRHGASNDVFCVEIRPVDLEISGGGAESARQMTVFCVEIRPVVQEISGGGQNLPPQVTVILASRKE